MTIMYLEKWQGRCHLAAVQDLYSRLIAHCPQPR